MSQPSSPSIPTAAAAVFALFVVVGGLALYDVSQDPEPIQRAVSGRPSGPPPGAAADLPPAHPSIELPDEARRFLDDLAAQAEAAPEDVAVWLKLARARYRASLLNPTFAAAAFAAVDRVFQLSPDNVDAHQVAGHLAYDGERFVDAEKHYRKYLELADEDVGVLTNLGSVVLFQDRPDEALTIYRRAIELDPEFLQAHFNLGYALQQTGDTDGALKAFRHALTLTEDPGIRQRIEQMIAIAEGRAPAPPPAAAPGGAGAPAQPNATAPANEVASNGASALQKAVDATLIAYPVLGPKVASIDWEDDVTVAARMASFPMDQMPEAVRTRFKAGLGAKLVTIAADKGSDRPILVKLVDSADGRVMDTVGGETEPAAP